MATKVKPCRIKATGTPQAWYVPKYVDADTFQWWTWGWWSDIEYVTQAEYTALLPWAESDWKHYFIYTSYTPRLPAEYQEVEYIQSSWTQWIDTWVLPTVDTKSQIKVQFLAYTWDCVYGFQTSDGRDYRFFNAYAYSSWQTFDNGRCVLDFPMSTNWRIKTSAWTLFTWIDYELEISNRYVKNLSTNTDIVSWTAQSQWAVTVTNSITLNWQWTRHSQNKWYYVKIWEGVTQVRDLVPCYRKSDSVIWMYDLVNDVFYTNSWTWTFTKWSNV